MEYDFNWLVPGRFNFKFRLVIFKPILVNGGWGISNEIALRWMPQDLTDDKSTLVQVMAWCRQATIHSLSQCWPRSMSPNGVTRPQWVKRDDNNTNVMNFWYFIFYDTLASHAYGRLDCHIILWLTTDHLSQWVLSISTKATNIDCHNNLLRRQ